MPLARQIAEQWVEESAARVAAAAVVPVVLPGAHTLLCTAVEAYMIAQVARIYGRRLRVVEALALIPSLGGAVLVGKSAAAIVGELAGLVPFGGWIAKGAVAGATAFAVGTAAVAYFERRHPGAEAAPFEVLHLAGFIGEVFTREARRAVTP